MFVLSSRKMCNVFFLNFFTFLSFVRMPVLYEQLETSGRVLSSLFFLCLSLGGITSLLAMIELPVRTLQEMQGTNSYSLICSFVYSFIHLFIKLNLFLMLSIKSRNIKNYGCYNDQSKQENMSPGANEISSSSVGKCNYNDSRLV